MRRSYYHGKRVEEFLDSIFTLWFNLEQCRLDIFHVLFLFSLLATIFLINESRL